MKKCACGHELAEDAAFCPSCGKAIESDVVKAVKSAVAEGTKAIGEKVDGLEKRVVALEQVPAEKRGAPSIIVPEYYAGRKLRNQGIELREKGLKNPARYAVAGDTKKMDELCKFYLGFLEMAKGNAANQEVAQDFLKMQQEIRKTTHVEGTDSQGGYLVPVEYQWELIELARETSFLLQNARTLTMTAKELKMPQEATLMGLTWEDEAATIDDQDATWGQLTLTAKKLAGLTTGFSSELLNDSAIDVVSMIMNQFAYAQSQELDEQALVGTGSPCSGVLTAAAGYSTTMPSGSTSFANVRTTDILEMISKLTGTDLASAMFITSRLGQFYVRDLKDSNGRPIYVMPSDAKLPGALYGIPYITSEQAPTSDASNTAWMSLGSWKNFYVGNRQGMTIAVDPYTGFSTDMTRFRVISRVALALARATAFARLITHS